MARDIISLPTKEQARKLNFLITDSLMLDILGSVDFRLLLTEIKAELRENMVYHSHGKENLSLSYIRNTALR